jgi:hypothetical protein
MMFKCDKDFKRFLESCFPLFSWVIVFITVIALSSCVEQAVSQDLTIIAPQQSLTVPQTSLSIVEVSPPEIIQELRADLSVHQPQVKILTPQADEVLSEDAIAVKLQVRDLQIFQNPKWKLGPHLHLILDNQPYISIYNLDQPLVLPNLSPGTHTLRVFAVYPWDESFKNEGAYAQTTFHILTKTDDNNPDPLLPLLTYNLPQDTYGAEPILVDYYLTNAPLHAVALDNPDDKFSNWRIRTTVNGESFTADRWHSIYLKGFKSGKNWIKLEFLDNQGNPIKNVLGTTTRLITYKPDGQDTLAKIIRKELTVDQVRGIVDEKYAEHAPDTTKVPEVQIPEIQVPEIKAPPVPQAQPEEQPTPKLEVPETPKVESTPFVKPTPTIIPEVEESPGLQPQPKEQASKK